MKASVDGSRYALVAGAVASVIWLIGLLMVGGMRDTTNVAPVPVHLTQGAYDGAGEGMDPTLMDALVTVNRGDLSDRTGYTALVNVLRPAAPVPFEGAVQSSS